MLDWGMGHYENTAAQLQPVAAHVVGLADIEPGEDVLDIGCGTGNAALIAARAGAITTGVDPAPRLLDVARNRAAADALEIDFIEGQAEELPFDDAFFDVVFSIFGVIFASDAGRALSEVVRVLRPAGRALITAWIPEGAIHEMVGTLSRGVAEASGSSADRFPWHDAERIGALVAPHGAVVSYQEADLAFVGESPEAYFAREETAHPLSIAMRPVLEDAGTYARVREEAIAALRDGNEDPGAFRVTSRYRVIEIRRSS